MNCTICKEELHGIDIYGPLDKPLCLQCWYNAQFVLDKTAKDYIGEKDTEKQDIRDKIRYIQWEIDDLEEEISDKQADIEELEEELEEMDKEKPVRGDINSGIDLVIENPELTCLARKNEFMRKDG